MKIQKYKPGDHRKIADLFHETVHTVCAEDYTSEQLNAWAPPVINYEKWRLRCMKKMPLLVGEGKKIIGFAEFEADGHIDCFYIHKDFQRKGAGTLLLEEIEAKALASGLQRIFAEVSITAKPFFERHAFQVTQTNQVKMNNQVLINFLMIKNM